MLLRELLNKLDLKLKLKSTFVDVELKLNESDKEAAWWLYVELITRIVTQKLEGDSGDEKNALDSVHSLFGITRKILIEKGRKALNFSKIAIVVLNSLMRPFTAKWHRISLDDGFDDEEKCKEFRVELEELRISMLKYSCLLAHLAEVEDLSSFSENEFELEKGYICLG